MTISAGSVTVGTGYAPIRLFHLSHRYATHLLIPKYVLSQHFPNLQLSFWQSALQMRSADPPQSRIQLIRDCWCPQSRPVTTTVERAFVHTATFDLVTPL